MVQKTLRHINAMHSPDRLSGSAKTSCMDLHLRRILNVLINENQEEDLDSARRYMYHLTFQTIEEDTVWSAVMDSHMDIKQVRGGVGVWQYLAHGCGLGITEQEAVCDVMVNGNTFPESRKDV